jgi:hypothetical protein
LQIKDLERNQEQQLQQQKQLQEQHNNIIKKIEEFLTN